MTNNQMAIDISAYVVRRNDVNAMFQDRKDDVNRIYTDKRSEIVEKRIRFGDFQGDTVVGNKHKGVLLTLVDRMSCLTIIRAQPKRKAVRIANSSVEALSCYPVKTVTYHNCKEFAQHEKIIKTLDADVFFAKPYASYQRGANENTNGLIR